MWDRFERSVHVSNLATPTLHLQPHKAAGETKNRPADPIELADASQVTLRRGGAVQVVEVRLVHRPPLPDELVALIESAPDARVTVLSFAMVRSALPPMEPVDPSPADTWSVDTLDSDLDLALLSAAETSLHVRPDTAGLRAHLGRFTSLRHLHAHRCTARDLAALAAHPSLEGILLEADEAPDASWSELLASLPSLRSVRVVLPWRAFRAALARVASLPRLTSLTLECVGDTPDTDGLAALSAARSLTRLVVSRPTAWGAATRALSALPALSALTVDRPSSMTADALAALPSLAGLRALDLVDIPSLTALSYAPLGAMRGLDSLGLHGKVPPTVAPIVAELRALRALDIGWSSLEGKALAVLTSLTAVERLGIANTKASGSVLAAVMASMPLRQVTAPFVKVSGWLNALSQAGAIESLDLAHSDVSDAALRRLAKAPRLHTLSLEQCQKVTGAGLAALAKSPSLRSLRISYAPGIAPSALASLAQSRLDAVHIHGMPVGDDGLASLTKIPTLRALGLAYAQGITDDGLRSLTTASRLRDLDLQGQHALGPDTARALAAALPLERLSLWGCPRVDGALLHELRALRPGVRLGAEDWQRGRDPLRAVGSVVSPLPTTVLGPGLRRAIGHDFAKTAEHTPWDAAPVPGPAVRDCIVHAAVFRRTGSLLATGKRGVAVHALPDGALRCTLALEPAADAHHAACDPRGEQFAVLGGGHLHLHEGDSGAPRWTRPLEVRDRGACFTDDGRAVLVFGRGGVALHDARTGEARWVRATPTLGAAALGGALHVVTEARTLERWSLDDGATLDAWQAPEVSRGALLVAGPGWLCARRAKFHAPLSYLTVEVRFAHGSDGAVVVVIDASGFQAELWRDRCVVVIDTGTNQGRADLSDDASRLLLTTDRTALSTDLYDVEALCAYAEAVTSHCASS